MCFPKHTHWPVLTPLCLAASGRLPLPCSWQTPCARPSSGAGCQSRMLRVGLTGGLGSGKSTVAGMFAELGAAVISADKLGRQLMQPGEPVYAAIVKTFGSGVVRSDGSLDRKKLAELAFQHNQADALNHIVHPAVVAAEEEWMRGVFAADPKRVAIVESALIFEVEKWGTAPGWVERFDKLILVTVPDEVKIARFISRIMAKEGTDGGESRL